MNAKSENKQKSTTPFPNAITAMAIARHFCSSANDTNVILSDLGWIKKGPKGWEVTETGKSLGGIQSEVKDTGSRFVRWPASILNNKTLIESMEEATGKKQSQQPDVETMSAGQLIDRAISQTPDWRGETFARLRQIIHDSDPEIIEELKWMGAPVWSHAGIVCIGNILKDRVQLSIVNGAIFPDPDKIFNTALMGKRRAVDIYQGDTINEPALKAIIRSAVNFNLAKAKPAGTKGTRGKNESKSST